MNKPQKNIYLKSKVIKPWGEEHVVYQNKNFLGITLLKIKYNQNTSLHCHPKKKTGFILLEGTAKIQLGLWAQDSKIYKSPSKLMIRSGLFHSIKAISKKGLIALEFETPVKKNDLVRFEDSYGRSLKPYEGKNKIIKLSKKDIIFKIPKLNYFQKFKIGNSLITLRSYTNSQNIIKKKDSTIFAVIDGSIVDNKKRNILSRGDIIKTGTFKKLFEKFNIHKKLTLLSVE